MNLWYDMKDSNGTCHMVDVSALMIAAIQGKYWKQCVLMLQIIKHAEKIVQNNPSSSSFSSSLDDDNVDLSNNSNDSKSNNNLNGSINDITCLPVNEIIDESFI